LKQGANWGKVTMLILDGTIGSDVSVFLARLHEDTPPCTIMMYAEWLATHSHRNCNDHENLHPEGIIYLRVMPEIAFARIQKRALIAESDITLDYIQHVYQQKDELFIENKNSPKELQDLPVLVLNGNVDFQTDFAQFYNHLFYIKRLLIQIQEKKDVALGIYKEKSPQRHCC
jgi:deoxyadenosine/deoxycytidine kinase